MRSHDCYRHRRGLPVALGILYIHAARAARMDAYGLHAPGHFLLKLTVRGSEALVDPFAGGATVERDQMTPQVALPIMANELGEGDVPGAYEPVSDVDVLLRLQNNIRNRALRNRDSERAIEIGRRMAQLAPYRPPLWLDLARLHESAGALSAGAGLQHCLKASPAADCSKRGAPRCTRCGAGSLYMALTVAIQMDPVERIDIRAIPPRRSAVRRRRAARAALTGCAI